MLEWREVTTMDQSDNGILDAVTLYYEELATPDTLADFGMAKYLR